MLGTSAPDADLLKSEPRCEMTDRGAPTRRAKIAYLLRRRGPAAGQFAELLNSDIDNVLSLFRTFNDGTHGHTGRFTITELTALRTRVESAVSFIHHVVSTPSG